MKGQRSKYGVRTDAAGKLARTRDGILFDSLAECRRYCELKLLKLAGEVWDLELQPVFVLRVPSTTGTAMGAAKALAGTHKDQLGEYRADFAYHTPQGRVVEDVKGIDTPLSRWKRKHVLLQYGLTVQLVRRRR